MRAGTAPGDVGYGRTISDFHVAEVVASEAGALLCEVRAQLAGEDPATVRAEGDRRSHELISRRLASLRPGDCVLSEEAADDSDRVHRERVWIVDPLDGTREFSEPGRVDWAVHVALWERGALAAGAVALPALGHTYSMGTPLALPPATGDRPRLAVSRTRPPDAMRELAVRLAADLVPMGSAGAKAMAVLRGEADAYVHAGGQFEWDSAAPVAVATASGLHASRIDGSPLQYNCADPRLPDLVICRPELAAGILSAIDELRPAFDP